MVSRRYPGVPPEDQPHDAPGGDRRRHRRDKPAVAERRPRQCGRQQRKREPDTCQALADPQQDPGGARRPDGMLGAQQRHDSNQAAEDDDEGRQRDDDGKSAAVWQLRVTWGRWLTHVTQVYRRSSLGGDPATPAYLQAEARVDAGAAAPSHSVQHPYSLRRRVAATAPASPAPTPARTSHCECRAARAGSRHLPAQHLSRCSTATYVNGLPEPSPWVSPERGQSTGAQWRRPCI